MLELAQKDLEDIRRLVLVPTPGNFQAIEGKLQSLTGTLSQLLADPALIERDSAAVRTFVGALPVELAQLRTLMQAPVSFYRGLHAIRAAHFGSYERSGELRSLDAKPFSRTVMHL